MYKKLNRLTAVTEDAAANQFAEYTANTAFTLTLSKGQISFLIDLSDHGQHTMYHIYTHFITALNGCERRGLVGREVVVESGTRGKGHKYVFFVTEAGQHVVALLKLAGHVGMIKKS